MQFVAFNSIITHFPKKDLSSCFIYCSFFIVDIILMLNQPLTMLFVNDKYFFNFCSLCFKPVLRSSSDHYCKDHLTGTYKYRRDRGELISSCTSTYYSTSGRLKKIQLLSSSLDKLSVSPADVLKQARKMIYNGRLDIEEALKLVQSNYKHASKFIIRDSFVLSHSDRWVKSYFVRLGYLIIQVEDMVLESSQDEIFNAIIHISARWNAYKTLEGYFSDGRGRPSGSIFDDIDKDKMQIIDIIKSVPLKPNGKINRQISGERLNVSRHKAGRIIEKLKSDGDIDGDM